MASANPTLDTPCEIAKNGPMTSDHMSQVITGHYLIPSVLTPVTDMCKTKYINIIKGLLVIFNNFYYNTLRNTLIFKYSAKINVKI